MIAEQEKRIEVYRGCTVADLVDDRDQWQRTANKYYEAMKESEAIVRRLDRQLAEANCQLEALAHKFAAAPAMYDALERIANEPCDHGPGFCPRLTARAALAAARGE